MHGAGCHHPGHDHLIAVGRAHVARMGRRRHTITSDKVSHDVTSCVTSLTAVQADAGSTARTLSCLSNIAITLIRMQGRLASIPEADRYDSGQREATIDLIRTPSAVFSPSQRLSRHSVTTPITVIAQCDRPTVAPGRSCENRPDSIILSAFCVLDARNRQNIAGS